MKKWIPKSVDDLIDKLDSSKTGKYYSLDINKGEEDIIFNKEDGDIWKYNNIEYTINNGVVQSVKSKILDDELKDIKLPRFCPICNKKIEHILDIDSWWINGKCYDCFIADDNLLRTKKNYQNISKLKDIIETVALLEAELHLYEELLDTINRKISVVENSDGAINEWTADKEDIDKASKELNVKIADMKKYIRTLKKEKHKYE